VLAEVLQGFQDDSDYRASPATCWRSGGVRPARRARAIRVAENYRALRKRGVTVRKTIDAVIATFCIEQRLPLLYSDRDFDPFVERLGLRRATGGGGHSKDTGAAGGDPGQVRRPGSCGGGRRPRRCAGDW
jgi:hypothetical protein